MSVRPHRGSRRPVGLLATLPLVLAVALSGCGGSSSNNSSGSGGGGSTAAKTLNLAMITAATNQNAFQEMAHGAQAFADTTPGINLTNVAPNAINPTQEVQMFQSAMQTSKDGIATMTTDPPSFVRPFSQAVAAGIPVVAVDAGPMPASKVTTFVGNSNTDVGKVMAEQIIKKIPADSTGEVVIGDDIPALPLLSLRIDGMKQVLKAERPNVKILGPFNVTAEPTSNYQNWSSLVKKYPNAVAYLAPGDQDAVSMYRISKQNHKHYLVGACDVDPVALQAVKEGYVEALGDPWHFMKGYIAMWLLEQNGRGKMTLPQGWFNPGEGLITQSNVDQVITREQSNTARLAFFQSTIDKETANPSAYIKPLADAN
jgi:ribose transport system substrate-binding protein